MKEEFAPICLFVYNRIFETEQTVNSLINNNIAKESELFVFCDGGRSEADWVKVNEVRKFIGQVSGFKSLTVFENPTNMGLAKSIIDGVTKVIDKYGKVIVLEDDLRTSKNFLDFMNQGLNFYHGQEKIQSISGYTMPLKSLECLDRDYYYGLRASSWGWATWDYVWNAVDWEIKDYKEFIADRKKRSSFNKGGRDMSQMLSHKIMGKNNSWAIVFCYDQWKKGRVSVFPSVSKVENIGFSENATNTKAIIPEYIGKLDDTNNIQFEFEKEINLNPKILREFAFNFSYYIRIKNKLVNLFRNMFR